jgi:predicted small lipoprotein YifL
MTKTTATLLIGLGLLVAPGCGRKGPLELPQGRDPMPVAGLTAEAGEGGVVLIRWTNPAKSVSGQPVDSVATVEVWVFEKDLPPPGRPPAEDAVEKRARLVRRIGRTEFPSFAAPAGAAPGTLALSYALPAAAALPVKLAFAVRVFDRKGRASDFAAPAAVEIAHRLAAGGPSPPGRCILRAGGRP